MHDDAAAAVAGAAASVLAERRSGVLLHLTSLPGPHGIGDCGPGAYHFVDWLAQAGQRLWQLLPLTPIGPGNSPYQSASAFAASPLAVALEPLVERGWLDGGELAAATAAAGFDAHRVDYAKASRFRLEQLRRAHLRFEAQADAAASAAFAQYCEAEASWLDDYALFMALETAHDGAAWWQWAPALRHREAQALAEARRAHAAALRFWQFVQWCFDGQWRALKDYANARGIALMGDLPIFIARHSADCWSRPDLYQLDEQLEPTVVAGVPPDYFSATGQRWGNPLFRWDRMAADGYAWWTARVRRALAHADVFRIDHFRGFAAYWEIPASCPTAIEGRWVAGPGRALFDAIERSLGRLPIVAEDLGIITPDVEALRDGLGFPGMKVLQFAFGDDARNPYLPHRHVPNCVVYTGTHDNDTTVGWWRAAGEHERRFAGSYLGGDDRDIHWAALRALGTSVARLAIFPLQDALGLDGAHRMNTPGLGTEQWSWRFDWSMVGPEVAPALARLAAASGRCGFERL